MVASDIQDHEDLLEVAVEAIPDGAEDDEDEDEEDVGETWARFPDDGNDFYLDAKGKRQDRFCKCSWDDFMASTSVEVECDSIDCLYWYHADCTESLKNHTAAQIEALKGSWFCDQCVAQNKGSN